MLRNIKKSICIIIVIAISVALLPTGVITVSAATAESGTCGPSLTWIEYLQLKALGVWTTIQLMDI